MDKTYAADMVNYIGENKNFRQASMNYTTGQFDYGNWENAWFIKNLRPCMLRYDGTVAYDLDKNDYTKKADGTASDVANDSFAGNAMVGLPTVWVKVDTSMPRKPKFYFADKQIDSSYKAYAHTASNGSIMDYTYLPIYNGWVDSSNRLRSISGKEPRTNVSINNGHTYATANGTGWDVEKFCDKQLINLLLVLISKTTDSQTAFGPGNSLQHEGKTPQESINNSGLMDKNGLFWGDNSSNIGVKVFGMEHYWGNLVRQCLGLCSEITQSEPGNMRKPGTFKFYYKLTYGTEDGSSATGFTLEENHIKSSWLHTDTFSTNRIGLFGIIDMVAGDYGLLPSNCDDESLALKRYCDYISARSDTSFGSVCYSYYATSNGWENGCFAMPVGIPLTTGSAGWWVYSAALSYKK